MRNLTQELKNHFSSEVTSLATCWKITRTDGTILGFTNHDRKLFTDSVEYDSIAGFTPSSVESGSSLAVDNLDLAGQFYHTKITEADLLAGKYDFAEVEIFLVNYQKPNAGKLVQKRGILGEVTLNKNLFYAEIRGLTQFLSQTMCESYLPHCRANLGDNRCKFDVAREGFTLEASVITAHDSQDFTADLNKQKDWFTGGYITWITGDNAGLKMEVKLSGSNQIILALPMPFAINEGDRFSIVAGCDKSSKTCIEKFNNIINFRGEPDLPSMDRLTIK